MRTELGDEHRAELAPDLEVIRPLGTGATAEVYLAREPVLERLVAVKILRSELAGDEVVRKRFEREARSAAQISHPNVTQVYRVGRLSYDLPYIVMEYVEGRTVRDVLASGGPFELEEGRELLAAVASGLAKAHEEGIIHRDVRPENVFVENRTGRAVLGDFGIAALVESGSSAAARLTASGIRLGEVRYMSPEQIRDETPTGQTDVYQFGVLAYEVFSGEEPFEATADAEVVAAHLHDEPRPLKKLRPELDSRTAALVESCLAKDGNRRPRAEELSSRLSEDKSGAPGKGAEPALDEISDGPFVDFLGELRRRRVYQVIMAYGAVALAVLGGSQAVYEAFDLPEWSYRALVLVTLAGFPLALILSWIYDITATGIRRTGPTRGSDPDHTRAIKWAALGVSVVVAVVAGWVLLRGS